MAVFFLSITYENVSDSPDFFSFFHKIYFRVKAGLLYSSNCSLYSIFQLKIRWQCSSDRIEYLKLELLTFFKFFRFSWKKMLLGSKPNLLFLWNCSINFLFIKDAPLTGAGTTTFLKSGETFNQIRFSQFSLLRGRAGSTVKLFFLVKSLLIFSLKWTL